jgi:hypothetical protein
MPAPAFIPAYWHTPAADPQAFADAQEQARAIWDRDVSEGRPLTGDREGYARRFAQIATALPMRRDAQQVVHRRSCIATPCMVSAQVDRIHAAARGERV